MSSGSLHLIPRNTDEIRVAIAGMGKMGNFHLTALKEIAAGRHEAYYKGGVSELLKKIRVCGVCDLNAGCLAEHPDISCYGDLEGLLKITLPHILIIASPTETHKSLAGLSLEHGVHTLVEKPLVTSRKELDELVSLADARGCRLMSGHVERYNPVSIKIVSLLRSAGLAPRSYSFTRTQRHHERIRDDIIVDKVIHDLDLALYFFGSVASIRVVDIKRIGERPFEAKIEVLHTSGVGGTIFVSWLTEQGVKQRRVEIIQGREVWAGDFVGKRLVIAGREITCEVDGMIKPENNQIKDELVDFIGYSSCHDPALALVKPLLSMEEIAESITFIEQIKKMVESGF